MIVDRPDMSTGIGMTRVISVLLFVMCLLFVHFKFQCNCVQCLVFGAEHASCLAAL